MRGGPDQLRPPREAKADPGVKLNPGDLLETLRMVWRASPRHTLVYAVTSLTGSALPAANLYVGKLLLDEVARAAQGNVTYAALLTLLAVQVGLTVLGSLLSTFQSAAQPLLGDSLQHAVSRRILDKAAGMSVESFENADTYD